MSSSTRPRPWSPVTTFAVACLPALGALGCAEGDAPSRAASSTSALLGGANEPGRREVVVIYRESTTRQLEDICTGTFVAPRLVLTSATCVAAGPSDGSGPAYGQALDAVAAPKNLHVYGDELVSTTTEFVGKERYAVTSVHVPEAAKARGLIGADVALLELAEAADGRAVAAVRTRRAPAQGEALTLVGYGYDGPKAHDLRRRVREGASVVGVGEGHTASGGARSAAEEWLVDRGPCLGDLGGPALDGDGAVVGVASRGATDACERMLYGRVDDGGQGAWLRDVAQDVASRAGERAPAWALEAAPPAPAADVDAGADPAPADDAPAGGGGPGAAPSADSGAEAGGCAQAPGSAARADAPFALAVAVAACVATRRRRARVTR